jgi:hypothetical protein
MKTLQTIALCSAGFLLSLAMPIPGRAAGEQTAMLKEELVKLEKQSWEAWKNHDGKFFESFLSDDHVEVSFGGVSSKTSVVAGVASGICEVKNYALDQFELRMLGENAALLTYHEAQDTSCQSTAVPSPCWVSSLYVKRGDRWLNVLYQQTQTGK